jgi:hypothetical protein
MSGAASVSAMLASGHDKALHPAISVHKDSAGTGLVWCRPWGRPTCHATLITNPPAAANWTRDVGRVAAHRGQID